MQLCKMQGWQGLTISLILAPLMVLAAHGPARADRSWPLSTPDDPRPLIPPGMPGRLVFGVMGSSHIPGDLPAPLIGRLQELGRIIGARGHVLLTGACPGMPLMVARAAKGASGWVVGVSAAGTLEQHVTEFRSPLEALDVIQLTNTGSGMGFIAREKLNIQYSDILVFVGGRTGTLSEILFAMEAGKVIALLRESTGVTAVFEKQILPLIGRARGTFVSHSDPRRLIEAAVTAYRAQARTPPATTRAPTARASLKAPAGGPEMVTSSPLTPQRTKSHNIYALFATRRGLSPTDFTAVKRLVSRIGADRTGGRSPLLVMATRRPRALTSELAALARRQGVLTVGLSPARTAGEHLAGGYATTGFDLVHLTGEGPGAGRLALYLQGLQRADAVFVAGGDHLTLGGTLSAMYQQTVVAVLQTRGMSGKLKSHILSAIKKKLPAQMIYGADPRALVQRAADAALVLRRVGKRKGHTAE